MPASLNVLKIKVIEISHATQVIANGINDHGQIVGQFTDQNGVPHGFVYEDDSFMRIDYPQMTSIDLYKINNLGQFVGSVTDANGNVHGFYYDSGTLSPPLALGPGATYFYGINNRGEIVGTYMGQGGSKGFLYKAGRFLVPNLPPGAQQTGFEDINDAGEVTGIYVDASGTHGIVYLTHAGLYTPRFDFPGTNVTYPQGINGNGQLGGECSINGKSLPFVSLAGTLASVNIPGAPGGASILGINARGQVCGNLIDANQVHHGYVAALAL
jgi:probable HAF family extracellular repeat protein